MAIRAMESRKAMKPERRALVGAAIFSLGLCSCGAGDANRYESAGDSEIRFKDDTNSNASPSDAILNLAFVDQTGKTIRPRDLIGTHHLVLVFVRGYNGSVCPYCSAYTSGLISNYPGIAQRDTNVLIVYPIAKPDQKQRLEEFLQATFQKSQSPIGTLPFPVVLDIGLKGVDALGIRKDLSKPATYILDKKGHVRFAYVGSSLADRPSIKAIIKQLDALKDEPS
jgi:peroxiredoxin